MSWLLQKCSWWIVWSLLLHDYPKDLILALDRSISFHGVLIVEVGGGLEGMYMLNSSLRQTLYGKMTHICSTVEVVLNYCKMLTSLIALVPLGAFQLLNREKVVTTSQKYWIFGLYSSA